MLPYPAELLGVTLAREHRGCITAPEPTSARPGVAAESLPAECVTARRVRSQAGCRRFLVEKSLKVSLGSVIIIGALSAVLIPAPAASATTTQDYQAQLATLH